MIFQRTTDQSTREASDNRGQGGIEPFHDALFAEDFEQVIQARAHGPARGGETGRVNEHPCLDACFSGHCLESGFKRGRVESSQRGEGVAELLDARPGFGDEILGRTGRVVFGDFLEIESAEEGELGEVFDLLLARLQRATDVVGLKAVEADAGLGECGTGQRLEAIRGHDTDVFAVHPVELV